MSGVPASNHQRATMNARRGWPLSNVLVLGALPSAVGCARLHARNLMGEWGLSLLTDTAELVVSELVTNAVQASTFPDGRPRYQADSVGVPVVQIRLSSDQVRLVIEVWDQAAGAPTLKHAEIEEEGGRGLLLVDTLCVRWDWNIAPEGTGKIVWAELRV